MATLLKNLSDYDVDSLPSAKGMKVGIVVAEWNSEITFSMCNGAKDLLLKNGASESDISIHLVPGSYELISGSKMVADNCDVDAVIAIGTVIQGETRHFDFICEAVAVGLGKLNTEYTIPFIFGVLTTDNLQQAKDRSGGKHGNKGDEAAFTAIKMITLNKSLKKK